MQIALYLVVAGAGVGLVLCVGVAAKSFWNERADYVRTLPAAISRHPERAGIEGLAEISFSSADGRRVAGWYAPSRNRAAIILVHGTGAERSSLLFETGFLSQAGFGVLAVDLPGQGASEGRTRWGVPERHAISAAVDWLRARGEVDPERIGGFGFSMGAYVLTQAAVLDQRLRALALVSSPNEVVEHNWLATAKWGLLAQVPCYLALRAYGQSLDMPPKNVIGSIAPRAVLIVGGDLDPLVPAFMARQLFSAAGAPKELWLVPRAHHADFAQIAGPEYRNRLAGFFDRALL
ncbi:MAG TPA: alpha/beta fold hydrolase [Steroidobacteraceae bacterium]|nr:alpha/beta fold hydrolase [Steroidobacteraceae bacterium]